MAGERRWKKDQLYYNPLLDKNAYSYLTTPSVMQHLKKQGVVAGVSTCIAIFSRPLAYYFWHFAKDKNISPLHDEYLAVLNLASP